MSPKVKLTKSDFMLYKSSPMHLWARKHGAITKVISATEQHRAQQGYVVEAHAKVWLNHRLDTFYTDGDIFWQPTYDDGAFESRADGLIYDATHDVYDIYEVKATSGYKKEHLIDTAFQKLVCMASIPVRDVYIVHLNKAYMAQGEINAVDLLTATKITDAVDQLLDQIGTERQAALRVAKQSSSAGLNACYKPGDCPCPELCHPNLPQHAIYNLPRLSRKKIDDLRGRGILSVYDVPDDYQLSDKQQQYVDAVKYGQPIIKQAKLKAFLNSLTYPLAFLDYETYASAVPAFDDYAPYENIVFQYSLHIVDAPNAQLRHVDYLAHNDADPAANLADHLAHNMPDKGHVIAWNQSFEAARNREMGERFGHLRDFFADINERLVDLGDVVNKGYYVHPAFEGSWSIKKVLPVLAPHLRYDTMAIGDGGTASMTWWQCINGEIALEDVEKVRDNLLRYCELDTLAMVELWKVFCQCAEL